MNSQYTLSKFYISKLALSIIMCYDLNNKAVGSVMAENLYYLSFNHLASEFTKGQCIDPTDISVI